MITGVQDYYIKTHCDSTFELQLYHDGANTTHTIKEILAHGSERNSTGLPIYPSITSICLVGVSLRPEDINLLMTLIKERRIEHLSIERVFLSSDKIAELLIGLQSAIYLKSLSIESMGLKTDDHAPLINKLLESCPLLTSLTIKKESQFNKDTINYDLININKIYKNATQYLSLINENDNIHLLPILKEKLYQELANYNKEPKAKKAHYNKLLTDAFLTIGESYQQFALPEEANHYFKRIKKHENKSMQDERIQKALTLYSLNKYAEGCESIISGNPINAIVPIAHSIEAALNTRDYALLERAENSLRASISRTKEEMALLSPPVKRFKM